MILGAAETQHKAAKLRSSMTLPEVLLWRELRQRPGGLKFRRQHPAGRDILDFFCAKLHLAVEVDGLVHDCRVVAERDKRRDLWLRDMGITVLRFPAKQVVDDVVSVVEAILAEATSQRSLP